MSRQIAHIGVLVDDIEEAIERWSHHLGWTFHEIKWYAPHRYTCKEWPEPHPHFQRIAFSVDGPPYVELLERNPDEPTHTGPLGFHHISFGGSDDVEALEEHFLALGVESDGRATNEDGELLLFFPDPTSGVFDGIRAEFEANRFHNSIPDDVYRAQRDRAE